MSDDHFLTTEEVLDYLQVNLRTVYRLIKAGKIPAVRVGRQWRFRKRDIDAWLDSSRQAPRAGDAKDGGGERPRILVVDDEQAVRDLLAKTLTMADYDVDAAPDGASGTVVDQSSDFKYGWHMSGGGNDSGPYIETVTKARVDLAAGVTSF